MAHRIKAGAIASLAGTAALLLSAAPAGAGTATYMSTDVPKSIDDGIKAVSTVTIPPGLPPATDLDVVGAQVSGSAGSNTDKFLLLGSAQNGPDFQMDLLSSCPSLNLTASFDDEAGSLFTTPGDCTATGITRKPKGGGVLKTLLFYDGGSDKLYADGTWPLTFWDMGAPTATAGPATLSAWGLRVTYEPMTFTAEAEKQPLSKTVEVTVKCSAACDIHPSGDARPGSVHAGQGSDKLKLPLTRKARKRLRKRLRKRGRGKANLSLEATNDVGDAISRSLKVKLTK
jgi:hypothetical protein